MFPALGAVLGLLHPITEGVLRRRLKFQTCTNTFNKFFLAIPGIFGSPQCGDKRLYKLYPVHIRELTALYPINTDTCTHISLNYHSVDTLRTPTRFDPYRFIFREYNGYNEVQRNELPVAILKLV